jgi:7-keto-8-aminopelargonate synthetase-like enzyme
VPPACVLAAQAALDDLRDGVRLAGLRANIVRTREVLRRVGLPAHDLPLPVQAFTLPTHEAMEAAYQRLLARGLLVPYVRYPDSLGGYFRLATSAAHAEEDHALLERGLREALA